MALLERFIAGCEEKRKEADKTAIDLRMLFNGLREFTMVRELTPTIVTPLIQRIEVHSSDRSTGHCRFKVDIYFTAMEMIDIPTEQELEPLRADHLKGMRSA